MITLYAMSVSGNCWKVAWMLRLCQVPFKIVEASYDGANGTLKTRSPEFLDKNPNGQTPLLELDNGKFLAESNAILLYLAETYQVMLPPANNNSSGNDDDDDLYHQRALVYQWLFFEQYSHEPYIAVRRANLIFQRPTTPQAMQALLEQGNHALSIMNDQLEKTSAFIAGKDCSVADIALFAYTSMADQGGFDLSMYPAVQAWLERIQAMPGYEGMGILKQTEYKPSVPK